MKQKIEIPELGFGQHSKKNFGFDILSTKRFFKDKNDEAPQFRPHRISFYGVLFTQSGEGFHFVDFNKYPYKKGTIIFLSKEQVHAFERNPERDAYLMTFTEAFLSKQQGDKSFFKLLTLFKYHFYKPVLQLAEDDFEMMNGVVMQLVEEFEKEEDAFSAEILHSTLRVFLCHCERIRRRNQSLIKTHFYKPEFEEFQKLLKQNILSERKVKFYAEKLGCSTKKLNRITQGIIQQPAKNYINQMLILEIKRMLMNTSLSIKEIAFRCDFDAPTNFVKYFRTYTGLTPLAFRREY